MATDSGAFPPKKSHFSCTVLESPNDNIFNDSALTPQACEQVSMPLISFKVLNISMHLQPEVYL